jgi:hypothetical protein
MSVKYSKWTKKHINIFQSKALQNLPKMGFLVPSGNPGAHLFSGISLHINLFLVARVELKLHVVLTAEKYVQTA